LHIQSSLRRADMDSLVEIHKTCIYLKDISVVDLCSLSLIRHSQFALTLLPFFVYIHQFLFSILILITREFSLRLHR